MVRLRSKPCPAPTDKRSRDLEKGRSEPSRVPSDDFSSPAPGSSIPPQASVGSKTRSAARDPYLFDSRALTGPAVVVFTTTRAATVLREASLHIAIRHGKFDISPTLRATVEEKVGRVGRFFDGMELAEVRFLEEQNPRISDREICEVTMRGHGHVVRARASATDAFAAVDIVVDKLEHQMTKLKGKLVARSHPRRLPGTSSMAMPEEE
jgi:putative sigma-54 modulation protein